MSEVHLLRSNNQTIVLRNVTEWKVVSELLRGHTKYLTVEVTRKNMAPCTFNNVMQIIDSKTTEKRHDKAKQGNHKNHKQKRKFLKEQTLEEKILELFD